MIKIITKIGHISKKNQIISKEKYLKVSLTFQEIDNIIEIIIVHQKV